ncbi:MAG: cache domain-containing sensor histidine kinase [Bacillota bacterium]
MLHQLFHRIRIRTVLLLSFVLLNVSLLLILGSVSYNTAARKTVESAAEASLARLRETNERLGFRLALVEDTVLALSLNPRVEELLRDHRNRPDQTVTLITARELVAPYARHPEIAGLHILVSGWEGAPHTTNGTGLLAEEAISEERWYAPARHFSSGWLDMHPSTVNPKLGGEQVVTHVLKLYNSSSGTQIGTLAADVRMSALHQIVKLGAGEGPLFIARGAGIFVQQLSGEPVDEATLELVHAQNQDWDNGHVEIEVDNRPHLLIRTASTRGGWRLLQIVPVDSLTRGLYPIRMALLWAGAACAAASLLLAWGLARAFGRPIDELVGLMRLVGQGRLDARATVAYRNEFGELQAGFNRMGEQLEQLVADLETENRRKRKAELDALQAQINPHFLYNTLDSINWIAIGNGQEQISEAVILLGQFFRLGLAKGDALVPLRQELEHLRTYIQLQQFRFRGSFRTEESFPPELLGCKVPKIILQPLVENALVHAFRNRNGHGVLRLGAALKEGNLVLTVTDDGVGMATEAIPDPRQAGAGYGIRNVHERIRLHFGPPYGIAIESQPGRGTTVTIVLPAIFGEGGESDVDRHAG